MIRLEDILFKMPGSRVDTTWRWLLRQVDNDPATGEWLDLDPPYQRDHVWTLEQREAYLGHILQDGYPGMVVIRSRKDAWERCRKGGYDPNLIRLFNQEVVDGKQRIQSVRLWRDGEIKALLHDGRKVGVDDLDVGLNALGHLIQTVSCFEITCSDAEVMEIYLRLNRGGTVHSQEELQRVAALLQQQKSQGLSPADTFIKLRELEAEGESSLEWPPPKEDA